MAEDRIDPYEEAREMAKELHERNQEELDPPNRGLNWQRVAKQIEQERILHDNHTQTEVNDPLRD